MRRSLRACTSNCHIVFYTVIQLPLEVTVKAAAPSTDDSPGRLGVFALPQAWLDWLSSDFWKRRYCWFAAGKALIGDYHHNRLDLNKRERGSVSVSTQYTLQNGPM